MLRCQVGGRSRGERSGFQRRGKEAGGGWEGGGGGGSSNEGKRYLLEYLFVPERHYSF